MRELRFALVGAGFWSQFQLAGWQEVSGVQCRAIVDPQRQGAEALARRFAVPVVATSLEELLEREQVDFVDIVSSVESHVPMARLALQHGVAAICQKPLACDWKQAVELAELAHKLNVPLLVHENWRWQAPIRRMKQILNSGELGSLVRARIDYANSFPVFDNQPALKEMERFILMDIGPHILDVARFLFGEASQLYCCTRKMRDDILGEDVATVVLTQRDGLTVSCNMSYASKWPWDRFPQTMVAVEGTRGGVQLGPDCVIERTDALGYHRETVATPSYPWADPRFDLVHGSIVACHCNLAAGLRGTETAETTVDDNLRTLQLIFAAYQSAASQSVITLQQPPF